MPHIALDIQAGKTDAEKTAIAAALTDTLMAVAGVPAQAISVSIEDAQAARWMTDVYPRIMERPDILYKKPGYGPSA